MSDTDLMAMLVNNFLVSLIAIMCYVAGRNSGRDGR
jgi:hypothetical protein